MKNKKFTITEGVLASRTQRFINFIVDLLIVHTILVGIATTVVIIGDLTSDYDLSKWVEATTTFERLASWFVVLFLYYFLTETYYSRTFAKYFTQTLVVKTDGSRPKKRIIFIRTLSRFIPLECITFLGSNIRGLHDLFSNTRVVRKYEYNLKKESFLYP